MAAPARTARCKIVPQPSASSSGCGAMSNNREFESNSGKLSQGTASQKQGKAKSTTLFRSHWSVRITNGLHYREGNPLGSRSASDDRNIRAFGKTDNYFTPDQ